MPETFSALIEQEDIHPAPYVGRYKWVMLDRLDALSNGELQEYIQRSYEMVAANAPKLGSGKEKRRKATGRKKGSGRKKRA